MPGREIFLKVEHDLLKHLVLPKVGEVLSAAEENLLYRRIFDDDYGIVARAREFSRIEGLEEICRRAKALEAWRGLSLSPADGELIDALESLKDAVMALDDENDDFLDALFEDEFASEIEGSVDMPSGADSLAKYRILVVDDRALAVTRLMLNPEISAAFEWVKVSECSDDAPERYRAKCYGELKKVLEREYGARRCVDVILMDLRFDDIPNDLLLSVNDIDADIHDGPKTNKSLQGLIMAAKIRSEPLFGDIPIVLMTSKSDLPAGASVLLKNLSGMHFVEDDSSLAYLASRLDEVAAKARQPIQQGDFFWGRSQAMRSVRENIELLSVGVRTILLTGPSGAGKSYLAEHVILPLSGRKKIVTMDLSALPESLVESELFGHVRGAFSGAVNDRIGLAEEADKGILFLDEIGNLSLENQRKLLLFLQDKRVRKIGAAHGSARPVDVKVVVATHLDLENEVKNNRFRFDLYMRLRPGMRIVLPELSDRKDDLPDFIRSIAARLLASEELHPYVLKRARQVRLAPDVHIIFGKEKSNAKTLNLRFAPATVELFLQYKWPGNTRELEAVLDTLILKAFSDYRHAFSQTGVMEIDHYLAARLLDTPAESKKMIPKTDMPKFDNLQDFRTYLEKRFYTENLIDADVDALCSKIFSANLTENRRKLLLRLNQMGIRLRDMH